MSWSFHPEAERELHAAIDYYEQRDRGLGYAFAVEVHRAILRMREMPATWPEIAPDIRRVLVNRFPFGVIYAADGQDLHVLAVMHLRRDPGYWQDLTSRG